MACNISNSFTDWDLHSFGVLNTDSNHTHSIMSPSMVMEDSSGFLSTGYLEDAVMEWSNYCKRKRLLSYSTDHDHQMVLNSKNCGDYGDHGAESSENFRCLTPNNILIAENYNLIPGEKPLSLNSLGNDINSSCKVPMASMTIKELDRHENISSMTSSFYMNSVTKDLDGKYSSESYSKRGGDSRRKVAYPFNMVKPGGIEGDVTLNDINERILMRPTRPIKHPVGDMACHPSCVSTSGLGPSGKAVVAFTRIHTQGRGTVTIIRTRG
ncbi:hypothetical protein BVC80_1547g27 [Macleaya cordata]|uniref:Protein XRI1 n=1 Tax=Macleaya cordata TaxID=56857 RepID=A0A200R1G3_MACCD|nr:hypothetical protein BVC80_1547g27 [Macleaya cordata]